MSAFHTRPPEAAVLLPCELKDHRTFDRISLEANEAKALNMHRPEKVIVQTTQRTLTRKQKQRSVKPHLLRKKKKLLVELVFGQVAQGSSQVSSAG